MDMLVARKLDDQSFEEIVREAVGQLPWLCPTWTDHNAHDPGITILELLAWYKEMLQYQMEQLTPALQRKLLALTGVQPLGVQPAVCALEIAPDTPPRLQGARLSNAQDMEFELIEPVPACDIRLQTVQVEREGKYLSVKGLLSGNLQLKPFCFGGQLGSRLWLGFTGSAASVRLWFDVVTPQGVARNRFAPGQPPPREICWQFVGAQCVVPQQDQTHGLSQSGYVTLAVPEVWPIGRDGLRWLCLSLTDAGCEEQPRLCGISDRRYRAAQQTTRARSHFFTVLPQQDQSVCLSDALAQQAELAVFVRSEQGWEQTVPYQISLQGNHRIVGIDAAQAASDGAPNVLVVCLDPVRVPDLIFDMKGRPAEQIFLNLQGQTVLPRPFRLICQTLEPDGVVRPAVWHCVQDLYACGPRDRVFVYDAARETIQFGDGRYGAVVSPGKGVVLVMDLVLSRGGAGNIPADAGLYFVEDGQAVHNLAASGGRDMEELQEAHARLQYRLEHTERCLSAADYERQAQNTPGLRVAAAKALPGYDPDAPTSGCCAATVTVVVIPASDAPYPMPDTRFLQAVRRQLEQHRTIGVRVLVVPPRYVSFNVQARVRTQAGFEQQAAWQALKRVCAIGSQTIGKTVLRADLMACLQHVPSVFEVRQLKFTAVQPGGMLTAQGDLRVPPDGVAVLRHIHLTKMGI